MTPPRPRTRRLCVGAAAWACVALAGCGGDSGSGGLGGSSGSGGGSGSGEPAAARVAVPERDDTPPSGVVSLKSPGGRTLAEVAEPGGAAPEAVRLDQPRLRGVMLGVDAESGAPRVRVSMQELITCRLRSGALVERHKVQYFPPSQIERIRSAPGARIPVRARRSVALALGRGRCPPGAVANAVEGELWGDVTNGIGLEAVTPHIRFEWER